MRRSVHRFSTLHGWKDHFTFSRRERKGIALLSLVLLGQCIYLFYLEEYAVPPLPADAALMQKALAEMEASRDSFMDEQQRFTKQHTAVGRHHTTRVKLFPFDPNSLGLDGWQQLGLSRRQAESVLRYRERGGRFRKKSDLAKAYGIGPEKARILGPYALLPDSLPHRASFRSTTKSPRWTSVELNQADSVSLEALPGIGPGLAGRIIRYRERLGGYRSLDQLREVWGVDDSLYAFIAPRLSVDSSASFRRLKLNTDSLEVFGRHPYVGWKLGRVIINYRKQHGPFQEVEGILRTGLIAADNFRKLAPYLEVSNPH